MKITVLALSVALTTPALAQRDVADFYRGKTVRIVVGVGVGSAMTSMRAPSPGTSPPTFPATRP
jgi:hypothetical protein